MASNDELESPRADSLWRRWSAPLRWTLAAIFATTLFISTASGQVFSPLTKSSKGSGRKADRNNAIAAIPLAQLKPSAAKRIEEVVNAPSIYRKLPVQRIECDSDMFVFMVRNPETVVHTWELMGITALTLDRTGPYQFSSSDGAGTDSQVELVYGTPKLHIYYGTGVYEGPLFKNKMMGQCVLVLRSEFDQRGEKPLTTCRLDVFIRLPQSALDVAAKTLHPLFGKAADVNFAETAKFFERLNDAATTDPAGIERLANRLDAVSPDVRAKMVQVAQATHVRATQSSLPRQGAASVQRASGSTSIDRELGRPQRVSRYPADGPMVR